MHFLGIDVGISYMKLCLIDEQGSEKYVLKFKNNYLIDDGIFKEMDIREVFKNILSGIGNIKKEKPDQFKDIRSISVSTHGSTFVLLDKEKKEISNAISVFDLRAKKECIELNKIINGQKNYYISGHNKITEFHAITKLVWIKKNDKELFKTIDKVLFLEDYIIFKLTGKTVTDKSIASISGLFDINSHCWQRDHLEIIGLKENNFAEFTEGGTIVGNILERVADETGLSKNVNITTGLLDALANSLGSGNYGYGKIVECSGTVLSVIINSEKPIYNKFKIPVNYFVNNIYSLLPYSPSAGSLIDWFGSNFYNLKDYYSEMDGELRYCKPSIENIIFIPYVISSSIINNDIKSRGLFFGIDLNHKKRDFYLSIVESIAFILKENIEELEKITVKKDCPIISVGGAIKNKFLNQIKADVLNRAIIITKNKEVGCLGVAILAAAANNEYDSLEQACNNMVKTKEIYNPEKKFLNLYEKRYRRFKEIYNNIKSLYLKYYN